MQNEKVDLHIIVLLLFSFGGNEFSVLGKRFGVAPDRSDTTIFSVEPPPVYLPWNEHLVTIEHMTDYIYSRLNVVHYFKWFTIPIVLLCLVYYCQKASWFIVKPHDPKLQQSVA